MRDDVGQRGEVPPHVVSTQLAQGAVAEPGRGGAALPRGSAAPPRVPSALRGRGSFSTTEAWAMAKTAANRRHNLIFLGRPARGAPRGARAGCFYLHTLGRYRPRPPPHLESWCDRRTRIRWHRCVLALMCASAALAFTTPTVCRRPCASGMRMVGAAPPVVAPRRRTATRGQVSMGKARRGARFRSARAHCRRR